MLWRSESSPEMCCPYHKNNGKRDTVVPPTPALATLIVEELLSKVDPKNITESRGSALEPCVKQVVLINCLHSTGVFFCNYVSHMFSEIISN